MKENTRVLIPQEKVEERIQQLADEISRDYDGKGVHLIGILKGSVFFVCELAKRLTIPVTMDFMSVSSYGSGTKSSGVGKILKDLDQSIEGKNVLIAEDIVDSGNTYVELKEILKEKGASESYICSLLLKPEAYKKDVKIDYVAMEIPNDFIVGFGLDYDELGRNYKDIYVLDE